MAGAGSRATDWAELRRRLEAVDLALTGEAAISPEAAARVLEERARALARPLAQGGPAAALEILTFDLGGETYGVESRYVLEVFRPAGIALLPGAQPPLFGVTAWRGDLLTLLDLRPMFGIPAAAADPPMPVVAIAGERAAFGLLVDAVHEVARLEATEVRPAPAEGVRPGRDYLRGVTRGAVLVLDAAGLLELVHGALP